MMAPNFWYQTRVSALAHILSPLASIWRLAGWLNRLLTWPYKSSLKVVCVGNITAGGTGKTPLVAALADAAIARGWQPVILTRGYGGSVTTPIVAISTMSPMLIGDEAGLLARHAPVVVAKNRKAGAKWIEKNALGDMIIMDDGLQNPSLKKDISISLFNGRLGLGNGLLHPAGPLRASLKEMLWSVDAVVIGGNDETGLVKRIEDEISNMTANVAPHAMPNAMPNAVITFAERQLSSADLEKIASPVVAFAGIGDPQGFFAMLTDAGIDVKETRAFPDHAPFDDKVLADLRSLARSHDAILVTTEKDSIRLGIKGADILAIGLEVTLPDMLIDMIIPRK